MASGTVRRFATENGPVFRTPEEYRNLVSSGDDLWTAFMVTCRRARRLVGVDVCRRT